MSFTVATMITTGSSKLSHNTADKDKVYCLIRSEWLAATPEEVIRQRLLRHMTEALGYPKNWLCVEKRLTELPHLSLQPTQRMPQRRIDVVCYMRGQSHDLKPLILVECKAVPITRRAMQQVIGYNRYVKAPFVCLINATEVRFGGFDPVTRDYRFGNTFPSYAEIASPIA